VGLNLIIFLAVLFVLAACSSPETTRSRGSGPGADLGNRGKVVRIHEGADPFNKTPQIIKSKHPPLDGARQADQLTRQ